MRLGRSTGTRFRAVRAVMVEEVLMQKEQYRQIHIYKKLHFVPVVEGGWEGPSERLRLWGGRGRGDSGGM